jgi:F-type H+-transporting ATPase subunit delta
MADYSTVARPYAKAIFDVARESGALARWSTALAVAASVVADATASRYLGRPALDAAERARFVGSMCEGVAGAELLSDITGRNLLELLAENDRLLALPEIVAQFEGFKAQAESKIKATLIAASAVDEAQAAQVAQALERKLGRKVDLELEVDPSLLGGAIIRAEDMVIDGSVRSRLKRLAETLID